jgi:hypothetical protein
MTGGSDFHGMYSTKINPLASRTAPENTLAFMLERCLGSGF